MVESSQRPISLGVAGGTWMGPLAFVELPVMNVLVTLRALSRSRVEVHPVDAFPCILGSVTALAPDRAVRSYEREFLRPWSKPNKRTQIRSE